MDMHKKLDHNAECVTELRSLILIVKDMGSALRTFAFRSSIIVGLITAVATILYLTPLPDQYPQSCSRPCHELDWPMICRVKLTLERYQTMSRSCRNCPSNETDCSLSHCITGDGRRRGILTVNREFPGPNLRVCQNDIIVVDIVNRIPGQSFGVHWRGQSQRESPHMDGVPMVTQCPIPSFTTFQYKFRATHAGTHLWQVNTGEETLETLFGAFIVRIPDARDPHRHLYDVEDPSHVLTVHTFAPAGSGLVPSSLPTELLINGKIQGNGVPPSLFKVKPGKRYRFRLVFGGDGSKCNVRVSIDDHEMLVFALDGNGVKPRNVTAISLAPGERVDFVLQANQPASTYAVRVAPSCSNLIGVTAELRYDGTTTDTHHVSQRRDVVELSTVSDGECNPTSRLCLGDLESSVSPPPGLALPPNQKFFLVYAVRSVPSQAIYNTTFIAFEDAVKVPQTNNVTMTFPSSPLLTQSSDVPASELCDGERVPESCAARPFCECIHVLSVKLGAWVELVLVNQDDESRGHVFHLHGYHFHVIGTGIAPDDTPPSAIRSLDQSGQLVARKFTDPVAKDTIALPRRGVVVLRFKATNPGYWLLDDEHSSNWSRGMSVILRVGKDSDMNRPPPDFPRCGNWIGPEFFLE